MAPASAWRLPTAEAAAVSPARLWRRARAEVVVLPVAVAVTRQAPMACAEAMVAALAVALTRQAPEAASARSSFVSVFFLLSPLLHQQLPFLGSSFLGRR